MFERRFQCLRSYESESESEVAQSCLTLRDPMDCSLPGSSIRGIFQERVLEWVAISFSRGSSQSRDQTWVSHIVGRHFTIWATREAHIYVHKQFVYVYTCICIYINCLPKLLVNQNIPFLKHTKNPRFFFRITPVLRRYMLTILH